MLALRNTPKQKAMRRTGRASGLVILVLTIALAIIPFLFNLYILQVANILIIYILLAAGLNILIGYSGQFALANAAIFGIGAYAAGLFRVKLGLPFVVAAPAGTAVAMLIGLCLTIPALRLSGVYLAFATTAFAWIVSWTFVHWEGVTSGAGGISLPPLDFGRWVPSEYGVYYMSVLTLAVALVLIRNLIGSRYGRALVALRDGEIAAQALGVDIFRYKALAFSISGCLAGLAGALYTATLNFVSPDSFTLVYMVLQLAMVVVGGSGSFAGPIVGATLLIVFQEFSRDVQGLQEAFFGALLLGFVAFMPQGLIPLLESRFPSLRQRLGGAP